MAEIQDDRHWIETQQFLRQHLHPEAHVIAPSRFKTAFPTAEPYNFSDGADADYFQWVVLHKGLLSNLQQNFLKQVLDTFHPVFANEVFVVYSKQNDIDHPPLDPKHLQPLHHLSPTRSATEPKSGIRAKLLAWGDAIARLTHRPVLQQLQQVHTELSTLETHLTRLDRRIHANRSRQRNGQRLFSLTKEEFHYTCRSACQTAYLGNDTILCRVLGRYLLYADSQDVGIVPHLAMNGFWETGMTYAVARVLRPGWHCIDVGANHGYYTLLMAGIVGQSGRVLALEPNPRLANLLQRTISVNGLQDRTTVMTEAVSQRAEEILQFVIPQGYGMNASLTRQASDSDTLLQVKTTTLDHLTENWERLDFLKIDAEGAEELIWRGMTQTLRRNPNLIIVLEFNAGRYSNPRAFLEQIQQEFPQLQFIDADTEVKPLTIERCLRDRPGQDWLLFLQKAAKPSIV
ncbi:MAG: FkbM family methyltransferase [Oculatellaceae cyanobacterium Prado106]|jgi:FkbM family methyltransferase|nr:FkbM family methyltransferase [Oculatellaceae cyanobacterium Prado106]